MKSIVYYAATAQQVALTPVSILKLEVTLNASATAGLFFQIHDSIVAPAEGEVPLRVWPAAECGFKDFKRGELNLALGCYVCLSTTAATKTLAAGGNDKCDILTLEFSEPLPDYQINIAGDLSTPVNSLQVWSEATGASARQGLMSVEVDRSGGGALAYLMIFAKDTVSPGDVPASGCIFPIQLNRHYTGSNGFYFGDNGKDVIILDGSTWRYGCTLVLSSTAGFYTADSHQYCIRAKFRILP